MREPQASDSRAAEGSRGCWEGLSPAAWLFFLALTPGCRVAELCLHQTGPLPQSRRAGAPRPGPSQPARSPRRGIPARNTDVFKCGGRGM